MLAGERIDRLLNDIAELQRLIDTAPPETLEDAAVKLRRLSGYVERARRRGPFRLWRGWRRDRPSLAGLGLSSSNVRFRGQSGRSLSGAVRTVPSQEETFEPLFVSIDSPIHGR